MQLVLASVIAAGGVIGDSTPAVIGAMIIAPLGTPIYGLALGAVIGQRREIRRSLLLLVGGIAVNILIGVLIGLVTFNRMPLDVNPQVVGRTAPTLLDLGVAVATGLAGSFALSRKDVSDILAGVAIAISLVPVLAVVGITLGGGRADLALGAFTLFLANAAAILDRRHGRVHGRGLQAGGRRSRRPCRSPRHLRHRHPGRRPSGAARGRLSAHLPL